MNTDKLQPVVRVEWLDITADTNRTKLARWLSVGFLLHRDKFVKGIPCLVLAQNWTGRKYTERITIPEAVVVRVERMGVCDGR